MPKSIQEAVLGGIGGTAEPAKKTKSIPQKAVLATPAGANPGYVVTTPNKEYSGITLGIRFRKGVAVIAAAGNEKRAARLIADYGYTVEAIPDYVAFLNKVRTSAPTGDEEVHNLLDSLG